MSDEIYREIENLLKGSCEFQGISLQSRQEASEKYKHKESDKESFVRIVLDGLMARLANNMRAEIKSTDKKISYQISLSASYVRTHFIINDMILQGDLVEAMTLTRKQLESLARMHELDSKPLQKLEQKTPNVINTLKAFGKKAYPHLSEIAHFASPKAGELLSTLEQDEGLIGPSMIPVYHDLAHGCFDMQALVSFYFLFWFIKKQKEFYPKYDETCDERMLLMAFKTAIEAGMIREQLVEQLGSA